MNVAVTKNSGVVEISLLGRFDSAASQEVQDTITENLKGIEEVETITIDMSELSFISSSGLRVIMQLQKKYQRVNIIGVSLEVYNVLKLTGMTRMMPVEKRLTEMDVEGLEVVEDTDKWIAYRLDDDTMVRVFNVGTPRDEVERELQFIRTSFILGMPTVMPFDMVRVGEQYGLVCELLETRDDDTYRKDASSHGSDDFVQSRISLREGMKHLESERFFLDSDASIDFVAAKLGTNRHYVSDYFNKTLKVTFTQYVNTLRLNYAEALIRQNRVKMSQVGYSAGFNSDHTFRRLFKEKYGCTPTEYQKNMKE